jgi:hypothetical protein
MASRAQRCRFNSPDCSPTARDFVVMQKIANCIAIAQAQIIAPPLLAKRAIGYSTEQKHA